MNLTEALTAPLESLDVDAAVAIIGQEKLRIRRAMDWRAILLTWEIPGLKRRGHEKEWWRLRELNARMELLLARIFGTREEKR